MTEKRELVCFVASPSGMDGERSVVCSIATEINTSLGNHIKSVYQIVKWETHSRPGLGEDGQDVLNRQLCPGDADVFICIIGEKYGTPTERAGSGTEEEFRQAKARWEKDKKNCVHVFFKSEKTWSLSASEDDRKKINDFREEMKKCGLYSEYDDIEDFKSKVRRCLEADMWSLNSVSLGLVPAHESGSIPDMSENLSLYTVCHAKAPLIDSDMPVLHVVGLIPGDGGNANLFAFVKVKVRAYGDEPLYNLIAKCSIFDEGSNLSCVCASGYEGMSLGIGEAICAIFYLCVKEKKDAQTILRKLYQRQIVNMNVRMDYQNGLGCSYIRQKAYVLDAPSSMSRTRFQRLENKLASGAYCDSEENVEIQKFCDGLHDMIWTSKDSFPHEFAVGIPQRKMLLVRPESLHDYSVFYAECQKIITANMLPISNAQESFSVKLNKD